MPRQSHGNAAAQPRQLTAREQAAATILSGILASSDPDFMQLTQRQALELAFDYADALLKGGV